MEKKMTELTNEELLDEFGPDVLTGYGRELRSELLLRLGAAVSASPQPREYPKAEAGPFWHELSALLEKHKAPYLYEPLAEAIFRNFFAPAPAQEPRCDYIFRDIGTGMQCDKKRGHDGDHHATMGSIKEGIHIDDPESLAAQPVENSSRCRHCDEEIRKSQHGWRAEHGSTICPDNPNGNDHEPITGGASTG
jgi:hypothetical protein